MIREGVFGAGGRMGAEVCRAVAAAADMDLVAAVDPAVAGRPLAEVSGLPGPNLVIGGDPQSLAEGKAEVTVAHHASKRDSPSGTSLATVREIAAGRAEAYAEPVGPPASPVEVLPGARGAERDGIHVHSVRLPGLVAHQEVIFGGPGQTLTIRHDTTDRIAFMPGVLLAVREVANNPGLNIGFESLMRLSG